MSNKENPKVKVSNLEDKLRKLVNNTKNPEKKVIEKKEDEKKEDLEVSQNDISDSICQTNTSTIDKENPLKQPLFNNIEQIPQTLESKVFEVVNTSLEKENDSKKREELYQTSDGKYESVENIRINNKIITTSERLGTINNSRVNRAITGILPTQMPQNESSPEQTYSISEVEQVTARKNSSAPWESGDDSVSRSYMHNP